MKASELRIGNLVFIENDLLPETKGKIHKVYGISEKHDSEFPKSTGTVSLNQISTIRNYSQFDEFIQPIPLTKEWLLKAGFEKDDKSLFHPNWLPDNLKGYCIYCENIEYVKGCDPRPHIKYVHQLQNLYFALTNTELKIEI